MRLPPINEGKRSIFARNIKGYTVGSWCPTPDGSGSPTAVAIEFDIGIDVPVAIRLKSPEAVDQLIQALLRHKRDVWPDSP